MRNLIDHIPPKFLPLIGNDVGIIRRIDYLTMNSDDPKFFQVLTESTNMTLLTGASSPQFFGGSCNITLSSAIIGACGEVIERYCGSYRHPDDTEAIKATDLSEPYLSPNNIALFHDEQFKEDFLYQKFDEASSRLSWTRAADLQTGTVIWVPSQVVYIGVPIREGEDRITYSTTSGLAAGESFEQACVSGILELIERDAFTISWNAKISLPSLDWSHDPVIRGLEATYLSNINCNFKVLNASDFTGIPTLVTIIEGGKNFGIVVGAASNVSIEAAWLDSLREAFQCRSWARQKLAIEYPLKWDKGLDDIKNFEDHVSFHIDVDNLHHSSFLRETNSSVTSQEIREKHPTVPLVSYGDKLEFLVNKLSEQGIDVLCVDLTTPDIESLGFKVVRVICPQLQRLDSVHAARFLGGSRLYTLPSLINSSTNFKGFADVNPSPHPFP